jgi:hypothetical protein
MRLLSFFLVLPALAIAFYSARIHSMPLFSIMAPIIIAGVLIACASFVNGQKQ